MIQVSATLWIIVLVVVNVVILLALGWLIFRSWANFLAAIKPRVLFEVWADEDWNDQGGGGPAPIRLWLFCMVCLLLWWGEYRLIAKLYPPDSTQGSSAIAPDGRSSAPGQLGD